MLTNGQRERWEKLCRQIKVRGRLSLKFDIRHYDPPCLVVTMKTVDAEVFEKIEPIEEVNFILTFKYPLRPDEYDPHRGIILKYALLAYQHECIEQIVDIEAESFSDQRFARKLVHPVNGPEVMAPDQYDVWALR